MKVTGVDISESSSWFTLVHPIKNVTILTQPKGLLNDIVGGFIVVFHSCFLCFVFKPRVFLNCSSSPPPPYHFYFIGWSNRPGFVCSVVINPRALSANKVDFGHFF